MRVLVLYSVTSLDIGSAEVWSFFFLRAAPLDIDQRVIQVIHHFGGNALDRA